MCTTSEVYNIFKEFYTEDRVDLIEKENGNHELIIHWPEAVVTNERDQHHTIYDMYAFLQISNGRLLAAPTFNRSTYSWDEYMSGYVHSHLPGGTSVVPKSMCWGSSHINILITALMGKPTEHSDEDWQMLALLLDKAIHIESLSGIPYIRMESIRAGGAKYNTYITYSSIEYNFTLVAEDMEKFQQLMPRLLKAIIKAKVLSYGVVENKVTIAMPITMLLLKVSNAIFGYINKNKELFTPEELEFIRTKGVISTILKDDHLLASKYSASTRPVPGVDLFTFKGNVIKMQVLNMPDEDSDMSYKIFHPRIILSLVYYILNYLIILNNGDNAKERPIVL